MIIKFSNLGAIKETELDLRPLTVIIGPNNTNKTYIAYSIYGLWKSLRISVHGRHREFKRESEDRFLLKIDEKFFEGVVNEIAMATSAFERNLEDFFQDSSGRLFSKTAYHLQISTNEIRNSLNNLISKKALALPEEILASITLQLNDETLVFSWGNKASKKDTRLINRLLFDMELLFSRDIRKQTFSNPFLLPAERNAFVLTYKLLANRRYKLMRQTRRELGTTVRNKQRQLDLLKEQGDILYPQPVEDFWDFLTDIEFQPNTRVEVEQENQFQLLADDIEEYIQKNNKTVLTQTKLGGKEIRVNVKKGLNIDLYNASSSIKQLAPLLLYLRYRAAENDLLIIDEPEMGLHPESQAKLLEALAILVNLGVKVLLTTHSPYFMSHLNNLVQNDDTDTDAFKKLASSLYLNDPRAFLRMDQVSAYEMKDNKLHSLKDEEYGIRWDTLSDVSAEIQQKYFEISEKREKLRHGRKK